MELIITEKPKAAQKIAEALADGKPIKESVNGVPYYKVTHGKDDLLIGCAVGHLYILAEKNGNSWKYPVFDVEWKPIYEINKKAGFSKKYLDVIKKLSKQAKTFTIATDYDIEGEVIGLNVLRFGCQQKDAARMKFSTLTKPDLVEAYSKKSKTLDWPQANAGETRHELDWLWGINTSRALTAAIKTTGAWKVLSTGRVQGPALKIIVDKEKEIKAFVSKPYWEINLEADAPGKIEATHEKEKLFDKKEADDIFKKTKGKKAVVKKLEKSQFKQEPPHPFDLTSLQVEAYRCFRISPKQTLSIAQMLYTDGYISYPRTSSQKLPKELDYKKILKSLSNQPNYSKETAYLLSKKELKPNEGKKSDPAHPAVHPTGETPKNLEDRDAKIYDLIVRRFLATFGEQATRETLKVTIDINNENFIARGILTIEKGWHELYGQYAKMKEQELPKLKEGQELKVIDLRMDAKQTTPPKRFTQSSIIKELTKKNLGTKATRASIVDTLYQRGYVKGEAVEATELGINAVETLEKFCPDILDEELTRHFELEMEEIRENKTTKDKVIKEAQQILLKILNKFKKEETKIGTSLQNANKEARRQERILGLCKCGGNIRIIMNKTTKKRFAACDKYPDCKTTFSLPHEGMIQKTGKTCDKCGTPIIKVIRKGKRPFEMCLESKCVTKEGWKKKDAPKEALENDSDAL